jgi:hypothetical protein
MHTTEPSHWLRWGLVSFCLSWPQTLTQMISTSQVARFISLSHLAWPYVYLFIQILYQCGLVNFILFYRKASVPIYFITKTVQDFANWFLCHFDIVTLVCEDFLLFW